jgi:hypothetical protein
MCVALPVCARGASPLQLHHSHNSRPQHKGHATTCACVSVCVCQGRKLHSYTTPTIPAQRRPPHQNSWQWSAPSLVVHAHTAQVGGGQLPCGACSLGRGTRCKTCCAALASNCSSSCCCCRGGRWQASLQPTHNMVPRLLQTAGGMLCSPTTHNTAPHALCLCMACATPPLG